MSSTEQMRVSRVAGWAGWCSPCESEDRPLVLTRIGPGGLPAWLAGVGDDDRSLLLTCNVCGHWQVVPPNEEDDPEILVVEDDVRDAVLEVITAARVAPPVLPAPRVETAPVPADVAAPSAPVLEAVGPVAADAPPAAHAACVAPVDHVKAPPLPVYAAVPAPRRPVAVLPQTTPAFSPEAVAAAGRVLAAARAQTQRTAPRSAAQRPAPLDRSRRTRNSATGRRTERPAPARVARAAVPAVATSIVLPAVTASQLVLATAR